MANCKYEKLQYQVSYDAGSTWENVTPIQVKKGDLIESPSSDCGVIQILYRWVELEGTYICDGNNKYTRRIQEESYDDGVSWYASYPTVYSVGSFVGVDEEYCCDKFVGHYTIPEPEPPSPTGGTHSICPTGYIWDGWTCRTRRGVDPIKVVRCNSNPTLTSSETSYYEKSGKLLFCEIGDTVESIGDGAFSGQTLLSACTIPSGVTSIGNSAFAYCNSLSSITIPDAVTSIGNNAFTNCTSLSTINIPSGVTSIGDNAFNSCGGLTSITVDPEIPPTIGSNTFDNTNYCVIHVPCNSLPIYRTTSNWNNYASRIEGVSPCTNPTPTRDTKLYATYSNGDVYYRYCDESSALTTTYTKPNYYNYTAMTSVVIGGCISSIGDSAFLSCYNLTSVTISDSVTSIGDNSFISCTSLSSITIPNSVTSIGQYAFTGSSLASITIPDSVTSISKSAFYSVPLRRLTIGSGCTYIGQYAFGNCSRLQSITMLSLSPPNLAVGGVFGGSSCPIYVPCVSINRYKNQNVWNTYATRIRCAEFEGKFRAAYSEDYHYSYYSEECTSTADTLTTATTKPSGYQYTAMTSVEIGDCVTSIGSNAFSDCRLTTINIPNSVTSIGEYAFSGSSLTGITIPSGVTQIGWGAFRECSGLTSIIIPSGVTSIDNYVFFKCNQLTTVTIRNGVTSIGVSAFNNCSGLTSINIPDSVTQIGWGAFEHCSGLTSCTIGSGITSIASYAFEKCKKLSIITVKAITPPTIVSDTALYKTNITTIYVPAESVDAYKAASIWSYYADKIQAIT